MTAMGRIRGGRFADRPKNIELQTRGSVTYFSYVFPDGQRKRIGSSEDWPTAFATANGLNAHFESKGIDLSALIPVAAPRLIETDTNPKIPKLIAEFIRHDPKRKKLAASTRAEQDYKLEQYKAQWPDKTVAEFRTTDASAFLNELTDHAYIKHRALMFALFQFAGHQGYIDTNPIAITLLKSASDKVRQRHTMEGYSKILEAAPDWLKRAMRIGLHSLQRREDVVLMHRVKNKVDLQANTITILQGKTRNYKNPVWIEIEMGDGLREAVEDCLRSTIPCPYLVHRRPERIRKREAQTLPHPFAVSPDYLSKAFTEVRDSDACKAYADMEPAQRPTFHELRSLGSWLYEQAGYSREYIMALSGHAKAETLELYIKDHAESVPKRVSAGLSVAKLPR